MTSYRRPRGTYVRPSPDWFANNLCSGSWYNDTEVNPTYYSIQLFNNDTLGRSFWIYGVSVGTFNSNTAFGVVRQGAIGSKVMDCVAVNNLLAAPPGQIFFASYGPTSPPPVTQPQPAGTRFNLASGYTKVDAFNDWPICILAPGYSVGMDTSLQSSEWSASFWYVPFPSS